MQRAVFTFDFISPFAYLAWQQLTALEERLAIEHRPVLFAAMLSHHGHKGPAEIPRKREFTYRFVQWQAERAGVTLRFPPSHPFNPLPALRLALALGNRREVIGAIFDHLWKEGRSGDTPGALAPVAERFGVHEVEALCAAPEAKATLKANTDAAIAEGIFGVPTLDVEGTLFFGNDAIAMLHEHLADPARFTGGEYARVARLPEGVRRG